MKTSLNPRTRAKNRQFIVYGDILAIALERGGFILTSTVISQNFAMHSRIKKDLILS